MTRSATEKRIRPMSFTLVMIGLLFFANSSFAVFDFLPDFIGALLIFLALERISRISKQMSEARSAFFKLFLYCAAKDVVALSIFGFFNGSERPYAILALAFANAVCITIFTYRAIYALCDGFYVLSVTEDCTALYGNYRKQGKSERSKTELLLRTTLIFLILREFFNVLPEFLALSRSNDVAYSNANLINVYEFVGLARLLCMFVAHFVCVFWIVVVVHYFTILAKQKDFRQRLYEKTLLFEKENPGFHIIRRFGIAFLLLTLGAIFLCDFYIDDRNILPDWVAMLLLLGGIFALKLPDKTRWITAGAALVFGGACILSTSLYEGFYSKYSDYQVDINYAARQAYTKMWASSFVEFLLFLGFLVFLLLALRKVIATYAGYLPVQSDREFEKRRRSTYIEEFDSSLVTLFVFGFLSGLCSFLKDYIIEIPAGRIFYILEFMWGIDFCFGLAFAVVFALTLAKIQREIRYRFYLENE